MYAKSFPFQVTDVFGDIVYCLSQVSDVSGEIEILSSDQYKTSTPNRSTVHRVTEVCAESFRFQAKGFVRELESQLSDIDLGTLCFSSHDRLLGCVDPDSSFCDHHRRREVVYTQ